MGIVKGKTGDWQIVIGLEVHAQIKSQTKLFSHGDASFGGEPNAHVDFLDAGFPGILPILNHRCVDQAIKSGLAIQGTINHKSVFDRKNYFYPDLPTGYQISQFFEPLVQNGKLTIKGDDGKEKVIRINRIHIEQDAGKSTHDIDPYYSYIDYNRAGVGLMEIVTEPDLGSPDEAVSFFKKLRTLLRYIDTCDGNMEEGSLRADANISLCRPGAAWGTRCEIKNLNSMTFLKKALEYEIMRQMEILDNGEAVDQETRLFNTKTGETKMMRNKENSEDYRYFPDPDLIPLMLSQERINAIALELPELPDARQKRYESLGIKEADALILSEEKEVSIFFDEALEYIQSNPQLLANWVIVELFSVLNKENLTIAESKISPQNLGQLVGLISEGIISGKIAKDVFEIMWKTCGNPVEIVEEKGLKQISDPALIHEVIVKVLAQNVDKVEEYKSGKQQLFGFFVGMVLKEFEGKAHPELVNEGLRKLLSV